MSGTVVTSVMFRSIVAMALLLVSACEAAASNDPQLRRALQRAHARAAQAIAGLLRRGQIEGSVRADIDPVTLAWLVLSQIHARQFRSAHSKSSLSLEDDVLRSSMEALARGG